MTSGIIDWNESSTPSFLEVAQVGFSADISELANKILVNPLRKRSESCGDIGLENGVAKCIQAAILRRFVFDGKSYFCIVGGMLAMLKDATPVSLCGVMKRTIASRNGSVAFFSNTACTASMKMNRILGIKGSGPDSCAAQRLQPIHWMRFAWYMFVHKVFHRPNLGGKIKHYQGDEKFDGLDAFWQRYVENAKGLCSSRSIEELRWAFGEDKYVILKHGDNTVDGYIVLKSDDTGNRWTIADWIALNNDEKILEDLLVAAKRFLKCKTHAMLFQTTGFPTFVQPILARHFKYSRPLNSNEFLYRFDDAVLKEKVLPLMDTKESWFFGPYDGDACLF